jgi:hypothetical protein
MKITIIHKNSGVPKNEYKFYDNFIKFLQKELPLKHNLTINFLGERVGDMTTGDRNSKDEIHILTKGRLNRDILRTLAHEWDHEYQRTILKRKHGPDIGGKNEDEANAVSGKIVKQYEKEYPKQEKEMYK